MTLGTSRLEHAWSRDRRYRPEENSRVLARVRRLPFPKNVIARFLGISEASWSRKIRRAALDNDEGRSFSARELQLLGFILGEDDHEALLDPADEPLVDVSSLDIKYPNLRPILENSHVDIHHIASVLEMNWEDFTDCLAGRAIFNDEQKRVLGLLLGGISPAFLFAMIDFAKSADQQELIEMVERMT